MRIWDVTATVRGGMPVWPGDPAMEHTLISSMALGEHNNVSAIRMSAHTGTHIDAPFHYIADGATVEQLDVATMVGPAQVVEITADGHVSAAALEAAGIRPETTRLLLKTENSRRNLMASPEFHRDFAAIASDGAEWLVERGIRLVGVDYLSVEPFKQPGRPTHHILLEAGLIAIEGIVLTDVPPGDYTLVCAPMKLQGADGAPARVFLMGEERG